MADQESPKKKEIVGLPLRSQLFGGYNKDDVTEYIENLLARLEAERTAIEKEKKQIYDVMKSSQVFCSNLASESQVKANELIERAQQESEKLLFNANRQLEQMRVEKERRLNQSKTDAKHLETVLFQQQSKINQIYEELLSQARCLTETVEGVSPAYVTED